MFNYKVKCSANMGEQSRPSRAVVTTFENTLNTPTERNEVMRTTLVIKTGGAEGVQNTTAAFYSGSSLFVWAIFR